MHENTFFASPGYVAYFENIKTMAMGYDGNGLSLPEEIFSSPRPCGFWSVEHTEKRLAIAKKSVAVLNDRSAFLQEKTSTGAGEACHDVFMAGKDTLMLQGWRENGQSMMKINGLYPKQKTKKEKP